MDSIRRNGRNMLLWAPVLFIAIVSFQLLGPTPIGLADNNDFARVLAPLHLWPRGAVPPASNSHSRFRYFTPEYVVSEPFWDTHIPTSEGLIARAAVFVSEIVLSSGRFDLRVMGVIHALLMTGALACFLWALRDRELWVRLASTAVILWMWTDVMYVQQFSTAYTDAGAIAGLCLAFSIVLVVLLTPRGNSLKWAIAFILVSGFLLGTKIQHATTIVPLAAFAILMAARRGQSWKTRAAWCAAPAILSATVFFMVLSTPGDYRSAPAFTVVFYKLAVLSKDPDLVLAAFGMPVHEFGRYIGHHYYEAVVPRDQPFRDRMRALVTPRRLASFYLRNPRMLVITARYDWLTFAGDVNLQYYGDLREVNTVLKKRSPEFNLWSGARQRLFRVAPFYPLILFGMSLLLCAAAAADPKLRQALPLWPVPAMVTFIAVSCFLFSSLLDAGETPRHLVIFQVATDLTILSLFLTVAVRNKPSV